jgi:putative resolvase
MKCLINLPRTAHRALSCHAQHPTSFMYAPPKDVRKTYGVQGQTLRRWAQCGKLRSVKTPGGNYLYHTGDLHKIIQPAFGGPEAKAKHVVLYARVSSAKQRADLERQAEDLRVFQASRPSNVDDGNNLTVDLVTDIGSGINWKRPGFTALLDRILRGECQEVVVAHRDRLCRFAFDLLERIAAASGCRIVVASEAHGKQDDPSLTTEELAEDLLAIVTVFGARHQGRRSAENRRKRKRREREEEKEDAEEDGGHGARNKPRRQVDQKDGRASCPEKVPQYPHLAIGRAEAPSTRLDGCNASDLQQVCGACPDRDKEE